MKNVLSNLILSLIVFVVGSGTLAQKLTAQSEAAISVRIPFSFTVGSRTIAPGTYQIEGMSPFEVSITNVKTGATEIFPVTPGNGRGTENGRLIFRVFGTQSLLSEVDFPGTSGPAGLFKLRSAGKGDAVVAIGR